MVRMSTMPNDRRDDLYAVLGLTAEASIDEIRASYRELAMIYHPDRVRRNGEINPQSAAYKWQRLTDASAVLLDDVKKRLYDIKMGFKVLTEDEKVRITVAKKDQAIVQTKNMVETAASIRAQQAEINGTIIVKALYGCLEAKGYYIDVTVPVQNMVDVNSRIICKSPTKESLEGFWDPTFMKYDKCLRIDYLFQNKLHSVTVEDDEDLVIPQPVHAVDIDEIESIKNERIERKMIQDRKRRNRNLLFTIGLASVGFALWYVKGWWPFRSDKTKNTPKETTSKSQGVKEMPKYTYQHVYANKKYI